MIWARVRDLSTGHHFDVSLSRLDDLVESGAVEEIPDRRFRGDDPRPPKHLVALDGRRALPGRRPADKKE